MDVAEPVAVLEADGLRVVFVRSGDRYAHRVEVFDDSRSRWVSALESLEGCEGEHWPPSPPFQQLHVDRRRSGDVVLLVGMAGRSHWSAAAEVAVDRRRVSFDVAARVQAVPEALGSAYCVTEAVSSGLLCAVPGHRTTAAAWHFRPDEIAEPPATISWRYAFEATRSGG